jgi:hypothetical protein
MGNRELALMGCFFTLSCSGLRQAIAGEAVDPCAGSTSTESMESTVSMVLKKVRQSHDGWFSATFELWNLSLNGKLTLVGTRERDVFMPSYPSYSIQYRDSNGAWVSIDKLQGTFFDSDRLDIDVHSRAALRVDLISQTDANKGASEFRVVLTPQHPAICVISRPFRAVKKQTSVTSFVPE